jgi:hypothetical protein
LHNLKKEGKGKEQRRAKEENRGKRKGKAKEERRAKSDCQSSLGKMRKGSKIRLPAPLAK